MSQFITLNTIIGNGKSYRVPIYQRDYSWTKDDWEDLWFDIEDIPNEKSHYLGYLVLQEIENEHESYWIIDGQQRLITLSLLALAVTALFDKWKNDNIDVEANQIRFEKITERYLANFSTSKLSKSSKLVLNRNNDDFYQNNLQKFKLAINIKKLKPSQRLMQQAYNYFFTQLQNKFESKQSADLADFLEKTVGNGIVFTQIVVKNDLDAFKVFETLNARGVKLSTADLLKNYLFKLAYQMGEIDLEDAERSWQNLTNTIQANDLTTFIRYYWNSRYKPERQSTLFKAIKKEIDNAEKTFTFLDNLDRASDYYASFANPNDNFWSKEEKVSLQLLNLLNVSTCYSLMLAACLNLKREEIKVLFKELSVIAFRYNLSDLNPNEAERIFSKVANDVSNGLITNAKDAILALKNIYVSDDNFEQAFATISINTRRKKDLVKYILVKIENQISSNDYNYESSKASIEHILSENPGEYWYNYFDADIIDEYIYRLGNLTLLESSTNNKLDNNKSFAEKLEKYKLSAYKLSNDFCDYDKFTANEISLRQSKMARIAKGIWKSAYIKSLV